MRKQKHYRVVANPYAHLDHEGRPAAAAPCDPDWHTPDRRHVGARHAAELLLPRAPAEISYGPDGKPRITGDDRMPVHDIWFEFDSEPQTVPATPHYRAMLTELAPGGRALLPANEATAKAVGLPWRDPKDVLRECAKANLAVWIREHEGEVPEWATEHPELLPEGVEAPALEEPMHVSHKAHAAFYAKLADKPGSAPPAPPSPAAPPAVQVHASDRPTVPQAPRAEE